MVIINNLTFSLFWLKVYLFLENKGNITRENVYKVNRWLGKQRRKRPKI